MSSFVAGISPNAAVVLLSIGLALIAIELNRPGSILPGPLGLLVSLLAIASLLGRHPQIWAVVVLVLGSATLLAQLRTNLPAWAASLATLALFCGFLWLFPFGASGCVHPAVAALCAFFLGAGTTVLTRIARRARVNKGLD